MYLMDRPGTILLIESDCETRRALERLLAGAGLESECAADGASGLRLFHQVRPSAVVLGLELPGLDGWEVLTRLRELSEAPVLVLAGHEGEVNEVRALRAGADRYVVKPFGEVELMAQVKAMLGRAQAGDARQLFADGSH